MTAGQRNCSIEIDSLVDRYSLDDVLFAVHDRMYRMASSHEKPFPEPQTAANRLLLRACGEVSQLRGWLQGISLKPE